METIPNGGCRFNGHRAFVLAEPCTCASSAHGYPDAIFVPTSRSDSLFRRMIERYAACTSHLWILPTRDALTAYSNSGDLPANATVIPPTSTLRSHASLLSLGSSRNPSVAILNDYDIPSKRNLALSIARQEAYDVIMLLDDDITISEQQLRIAKAVVSRKVPLAGFCVNDFPDVSTIEHIHRLVTGRESETMPGGNCLLLRPTDVGGIFPYMYNDDWLFVLHNTRQTPGMYIGDVFQQSHEPWKSPQRIMFEEFGEVMTWGAMETQWDVGGLHNVNSDFWTQVLRSRRDYLTDLLDVTPPGDLRHGLDIALKTCMGFDASVCTMVWRSLCLDMKGIMDVAT